MSRHASGRGRLCGWGCWPTGHADYGTGV